MGETDCVAGVVGFELRCAERKFISLRCRVSSDSGAPAETAAVSRENDLLRWGWTVSSPRSLSRPHCEPRTERSPRITSKFESSHPGRSDTNFDGEGADSAASSCTSVQCLAAALPALRALATPLQRAFDTLATRIDAAIKTAQLAKPNLTHLHQVSFLKQG
jgi:hypothetical protein